MRIVCVTHLLCVGGLEALWGKGCSGVVCELGMVLCVSVNLRGDGVVWGGIL